MPQEQQRKGLPFSERAAFERSDVWQRILAIAHGFREDLVAQCLDNANDIDTIRYAQGGIDSIEWFKEILNLIFEEGENGSST